jgi:hypothetical protein
LNKEVGEFQILLTGGVGIVAFFFLFFFFFVTVAVGAGGPVTYVMRKVYKTKVKYKELFNKRNA